MNTDNLTDAVSGTSAVLAIVAIVLAIIAGLAEHTLSTTFKTRLVIVAAVLFSIAVIGVITSIWVWAVTAP